MKPAIHQIVPSLRSGDAVGNTSLRTREALRELGYRSEIYREKCSPELENDSLPLEDYLEESSLDNLVIYHYSIGSEIARFIYHLPDKIVLVYHNLTPPEYFIDIHDHVVGELYHGKKQLEQFANKVVFGAGVSEYNRAELEEMGFPNTAVLPLALDFDDLDQVADPFIKKAYKDQKYNFLFVGRIVPNKGIEDLIKLYANYKKYVNHDSRLIIAGDYSGFERYHMQLLKLIDEIELPHVVMPGRVDFRQLLAFYSIADVYVSMSNHEGFCVPLLEAMYFDIPVLAKAVAAVPETMDGAGVLVEKMNYADIAEMMHMLATPGRFRLQIIAGQRERLERYRSIPFERYLESLIEKVLNLSGEKVT